MANYKTPGVYVEEITKFPPSVAQVETAIPAFIGYTEKAEKLNGDTLSLIPTRITSLLEYETYFGGADPETTITVEISDVVQGDETDRSIKVNQPTAKRPYLMYYSLQMYFANGGGPCYITSVADYSTGLVSKVDLDKGLAKIRKEDEPTLLLFPDATNLSTDSDFWAVYNDALTQCNELQDRFTIMDTYSDADHMETSSGDTVPPEEALRNGMTSEKDYAKYGAAYYPFLETILDYRYNESDIEITHTTTDPGALQAAVSNLESLISKISTVTGNLRSVTGIGTSTPPYGDMHDAIDFIASGFGGSYNATNTTTFLGYLDTILDSLAALETHKDDVKKEVDAVLASISDEGPGAAATILAINNAWTAFEEDFDGTTEPISEVNTNLVDLKAKLKKDTNATDREKTVKTDPTLNINDELARLLVYTIGVTPLTQDSFANLVTNATTIKTEAESAKSAILDTNNGDLNGRYLGDITNLDNATYNQIKNKINELALTLPPSSAMAGIYARIDSTRGVWKAPANVSVSYVIKPSVNISHEEQGDLNVHTTGKSINAIRSFTGKGTLVWGARTLAGNDNEWRYVPVRRFFNMVEESVSKASEQFVFEGNDANTWVRVRAMIENFLILQWKAGALAGSKADQAFYVRIGLGQTMTAQDILEGRMIIEIGMAVVRPAEFIILRFSHKMQEA